MNILSSNGTGGFIDFGDTDYGHRGRILYGHATDYMVFDTAGSEKMRIDTSGNVSVGTDTPLYLYSEQDIAQIAVNRVPSSGSITDSNRSAAYINLYALNGGSLLTFHTANANNTAPKERMRIDSSGDLNIVNTGQASLNFTTDGSLDYGRITGGKSGSGVGDLRFFTYSGGIAERMRIDSNGNVILNQATSRIYGGGTATGRFFLGNSDSKSYMMINGSAHTNPNLIYFVNDAAVTMRIEPDGGIFFPSLGGFSVSNSDVRYNATSDELYYQTSSKRYKSEITDLENSLDKVNNLRPVRFKDNLSQEYATGMIAEEVAEIIPEVVFTKPIDGFDEPQIEGINYSDIVPFLIKSIQELKADNDSLKARIETLENN